MKKAIKLTMIISLVASIICPILYNIIGSKILEDGTLDEPFYLVGLMWFFIVVFIVSSVTFLIFRKKRK